MMRSLYSGVTGLTTHQTRMDVIGNNIANVNTYGFKSSRTTFKDIYYQTVKSPSGGTASKKAGNNPTEVGYGVQIGSIDKNMSRSSFAGTDRTFDLAISGEGFFIVGKPQAEGEGGGGDGEMVDITYTRMGNFGLDSTGNLVNANNKFVLGTCNDGEFDSAAMSEKKPAEEAKSLQIINVNSLIQEAFGEDELTFKDLESFSIGSDGVLTATYKGDIKALARIEVAVFDNPEGLLQAGNTDFMVSAASNQPGIRKPGDPGTGTTESGKLEMSNVNLAQEFSDMIITQRGFQANSRIITTSDSMLEELVNLKR
ncbi:MAG: flagellar hook-basal body complex protein [Ruminococcus sp.]|nr:flagellar hook-basal body complex protein [Ruminococcus sp.]